MTMTLNKLIEEFGIDKINSATKYPSILTYHALGQKGGMTKELCEGKGFPEDATVEITEKVDGTNSRMVIVGDDFLIGSREEFVYAKGDRIRTSIIPNIVCSGLARLLENGMEATKKENKVFVVFGESYGFKIQEGSKVYCSYSQKQGFRVFDIISWEMPEFFALMQTMPLKAFSSWRDEGNQKFVSTDVLAEFCDKYEIERTPIIATMKGSEIPTDAEETLKWMKEMIPESKAKLDSGEFNGTPNEKFGTPEGLVIRTKDRSFIRKLRFQDYRKGQKQGWK